MILEKVDFKKTLKTLYAPPKNKFVEVEVPALNYLMIDGIGDPGKAKAYAEALETLYPVAYTLKFASKTELGRDYAVPPLEGLWWADDMNAFVAGQRDQWRWTMMIMIPDWIDAAMVADVVEQVKKKKSPPAMGKLRMENLAEGRVVQIMHIGPYSEEAPVLAKLHNEYMPLNGLTFNGKHHEIYLGDPRRTAPEKLKTVLRQPVRSA
ncbi:GyrI-like domain-containing protein [Rhizobium sp. L1K21]|uniref:GyrI-like domain-containing protein n=1 Tax=Rhizobium sp. L1K21 TaxID=2954933 RepID=UPI0020929657|nr:GyrI-like domain-containing protein [Rhizobium sp. L1K21]MCO6186361.1 GyrI-like domain-containing protein [Rhizobium sp. L1K21]